MNTLIQDTLRKIKTSGITPIPRWKYLLKKYSFWGAFGVVISLGAVSFAITLYSLSQLDWDLYRFMHKNPFVYSFSLLPYFWIILIAAFLFLAFFDLRKTEGGYRFSWLKMSLLSIGTIVILGLLFSFTGLAGNLNTLLAKNIPYYSQHAVMTKEAQWTQPDKGLLAGSIIHISKDSLELNDLNNKKWNVSLNEETFLRPAAQIAEGEMIKVIGTRKDGHDFAATEIRPWMSQNMLNTLGGGRHKANSSSDKSNSVPKNGSGHGMMGK